MRLKDLEQAILLEQKLALQVKFLRERGAHGMYDEASSAESFIPNISSYRELVNENCDTVELSRIVFETIEETSNLASSLYMSATGQELPMRQFTAMGERHNEVVQTSKLPMRAETFGGFDERKNKVCFLKKFNIVVHN